MGLAQARPERGWTVAYLAAAALVLVHDPEAWAQLADPFAG